MKKRSIYIDIIKIISCFLVIANHTTSKIFSPTTPASLTWFAGITYHFITKPAVYLFLMSSGAMLLDRENSYKENLKRIIKFIGILMFFSFLYQFILYQNFSFSTSGLINFLNKIVNDRATRAFWYLYMYLGIMIMLPLLQKLVRVMGPKDYKYIIILMVVLGSFPIITHFFPLWKVNKYFIDPLISVYVCVFITGYYIHKKLCTSTKIAKQLSIVYIILLYIQVIGTYNEYLNTQRHFMFFDKRCLMPITLSSICIFYVVKHLCDRIYFSERVKKVIVSISSCTLGIYLCGDWLIKLYSDIVIYFNQRIHPLISVLLLQIIVFVSGLLCTFIFNKTVQFLLPDKRS